MALPEKSDEEVTDVVEVDDTVTETETEETETDETSGDEESEEEEERELEPWELTGEEDEALPDVPVKTHIKAKEKWKRKTEAKNVELEALKAEVESLKAGVNRTASIELERPGEDNYDTHEEYQEAYENYIIDKSKVGDKLKAQEDKVKAFNKSIAEGVSVHNERVADFIAEKKINSGVYEKREQVFIDAIEAAHPGMGEANADFYLSKLGAGSEKIPYFLGGNKTKLAEFQRLLKDDHTGISVAIFLGEENARLRGATTGKQKSKAPKPAATATGDESIKSESQSAKALKKKYNDFHAKDLGEKAWDLKMKAKADGIDTSDWART